MMKVVVKKSGKTAAASVESGGRVVVELANSQEFVLANLLAGITDENIHPEIDFGPPIGRERL